MVANGGCGVSTVPEVMLSFSPGELSTFAGPPTMDAQNNDAIQAFNPADFPCPPQLQSADGPMEFNLIAAEFSRHAEFLDGDRIRGMYALLRGQTVLQGAPYQVLGITAISSFQGGHYLVRTLNLLSKSLLYRDTSVASDEALCSGTIIGMDIEAVTRAPRLERMITF